jgi:hypothetical protein
MDIFHVILDTSILRAAHFRSSRFEKLLRRSRLGVAKIYIPEVVLEERRTQLLKDYNSHADAARGALLKMTESPVSMLLEGIQMPGPIDLPSQEDVDGNSRAVFRRYLADNKVEILSFTGEHAARALEAYLHGRPPFKPAEKRETERKHIPDSWIYEAALEIKARSGRHCVLVRDTRFQSALMEAGFEVFDDVDALDEVIEEATAVITIREARPAVLAEASAENAAAASSEPLSALEKLRAEAFKNFDVIVLGMNEALMNPDKEVLFTTLDALGVARAKVEAMTATLMALGVLREVANRLLPTDVPMAKRMAEDPIVRTLLVRMI